MPDSPSIPQTEQPSQQETSNNNPSQSQNNMRPPSFANSSLSHLLLKNRQWAARMVEKNPSFFNSLVDQQTPQILWIGCSDSRVPANELMDLLPGEVFVHRNIANVVLHSDLNCLSVLQYAVEVLKVRHVIVCGHYGCGGVYAAMGKQQFGLIDNWLRHIKDVYVDHKSQLDSEPDVKKRWDLFTELNVLNSVHTVCQSTIVQNCWAKGQPLSVHGWCYRLNDGCLRDLAMSIDGPEGVEDIFRTLLKK